MAQSYLYANPGKLSIVINHRPITFSTSTARALQATLRQALPHLRAGQTVQARIDNLTLASDGESVAIAQPDIERVVILTVASAQALAAALPRYIQVAEHLERGLFLQLTPILTPIH